MVPLLLACAGSPRIATIAFGGNTIVYSRDAAGAVTSIAGPQTTMLYEYDTVGRLTKARDNTLAQELTYAYDRRSLRTQMVAPGSHTVAYAYGDAGRLSQVTLDAGTPSVYTYDDGGRRTRLALPNGVQTDYVYAANDRLMSLVTTKGAATLASFAYTHDAVGNRTGITLANGETLSYEYDNAYRLTRELRKDAAQQTLFDQTFAYDAVGNRTSTVKNGITTTCVYSNANQLTTETTGNTVKTYTYDANGSQTLVETRVNDVLTVTEQTWYDQLSRRTQYVKTVGGTPVSESFTYRGAAWHRRTQTASGTTTTFLYDGDNVACDFISGSLDTFYVTPFLDENLSLTRQSATHYYSHDGLGSVRTVTDAAGTLVNTYAYTAFGEPYAPGTSVTLPQRYTFTGREQNPVSDTMFYRYRPYSVALGMMLNRNPWGYIHRNYTLYDAMNQSPINYTEPFSSTDPFEIARRRVRPPNYWLEAPLASAVLGSPDKWAAAVNRAVDWKAHNAVWKGALKAGQGFGKFWYDAAGVVMNRLTNLIVENKVWRQQDWDMTDRADAINEFIKDPEWHITRAIANAHDRWVRALDTGNLDVIGEDIGQITVIIGVAVEGATAAGSAAPAGAGVGAGSGGTAILVVKGAATSTALVQATAGAAAAALMAGNPGGGGDGPDDAEPHGQTHHPISKKVHRALEEHPNLKGKYKVRDPRLKTRAKNAESHRGYQDWHRKVDARAVKWIRRHPRATTNEFEAYLKSIYRPGGLHGRFPRGLGDGQ